MPSKAKPKGTSSKGERSTATKRKGPQGAAKPEFHLYEDGQLDEGLVAN